MEINDKPLMASEIIGALGQPKRTIAHFKSGSIAEGKARETQSMLVNTQKFKVSNKLIDHAGEASMSKPHVLLEMMKKLQYHHLRICLLNGMNIIVFIF